MHVHNNHGSERRPKVLVNVCPHKLHCAKQLLDGIHLPRGKQRGKGQERRERSSRRAGEFQVHEKPPTDSMNTGLKCACTCSAELLKISSIVVRVTGHRTERSLDAMRHVVVWVDTSTDGKSPLKLSSFRSGRDPRKYLSLRQLSSNIQQKAIHLDSINSNKTEALSMERKVGATASFVNIQNAFVR